MEVELKLLEPCQCRKSYRSLRKTYSMPVPSKNTANVSPYFRKKVQQHSWH